MSAQSARASRLHRQRLGLRLCLLMAVLAIAPPAFAAEPSPAAPPAAQPTELSRDIGSLLQANGGFAARLDGRWIHRDALRAFYKARDFAPIWTGDGYAAAKAVAAVQALGDASRHGLDPADYDYPALVARLGSSEPRRQAELELMLSVGYVELYGDLAQGRVAPKQLYPKDYDYPRGLDPATVLQDAATATDPGELLRQQAPRTPLYASLQQALQSYRMLVAEGGWPGLPDGNKLEPGNVDDRVPLLRARLLASGDLADDRLAPRQGPTLLGFADDGDARRYDAALAEAVRRFQGRHGLATDAVVGPDTRVQLNVPAEERVKQIEMNLERLRWMPHDLGDRYIFVNAAAFHVDVVENGKPVLGMAAIVGEPDNQTPVFSDEMKFLEFHPYWKIPPSIVAKEIAPKIARDLGYLARHHMRVLSSYAEGATEYDPRAIAWSGVSESWPYRLRQDPGPDNPLGKVAFLFPNRFSVYLHDTPADQLFERSMRALSHGCVRLSDPEGLAKYLLQGQDDWTPEKIDAALAGDEHKTIALARRIPVHLTYLTAWVAEDGTIEFRSDIYGRDPALAEALLKPAAS
jgi:murein L,D-transpeptidase YcbB/YkuD